MVGLATWLLSVGVSDIVSGFSGVPRGIKRIALGAGVSLGISLAVLASADLTGSRLVASALANGVASLTWMWLRVERDGEIRPFQARAALLGLLAYSAAVFLADPLLMDGLSVRALRALEGSTDRKPEELLLALGFAVALVSTGNGFVRVILRAAALDISRPEGQLRGGRVIGPMERLLIFAFAFGGELTGAALIASAKGLLRFPEVKQAFEQEARETGSGSTDAHALSEYFLVGSLASWMLALIPSLFLFPGPGK
jgi:hypothetical protein